MEGMVTVDVTVTPLAYNLTFYVSLGAVYITVLEKVDNLSFINEITITEQLNL